MEAKKTPLYDIHVKAGGKMVDFAGWLMPIQYAGIKEEHLQVRSSIGAFDVSHMGEIWVQGPKALETLQWVTTNDVAKLKSGDAHYSLFPNAHGGIVDDLIVYCVEPGMKYLLCVNASNTDKDFKFLQENNRGAVLENASQQWGQIAIQGPKAMTLLSEVMGNDIKDLGSFKFKIWNFAGSQCYVARTGYTGEDGVEIFVPWNRTADLWTELFKKGGDRIQPIGLGARDTLRTEMKYSLYGHEIDDTTNAYEAGLGWVVKPKEKDFIGKTPILARKDSGLQRKLVGLEIQGRGIARQGYKVFSFDNKESGEVTSGTLSPSLNKAVAVAWVSSRDAAPGTKVNVQVRDKMVEAQVVPTPFVKPGGQ